MGGIRCCRRIPFEDVGGDYGEELTVRFSFSEPDDTDMLDSLFYASENPDDGTRESKKNEGGSDSASINYVIAKREKPDHGIGFSVTDEPVEQIKPTGGPRFVIINENKTSYSPQTSSDVKYSKKRSIQDYINKVDDDFVEESKKLMDEIKDRIEALQVRGVNLMFIQEILTAVKASPRKMSKLRITKDKRIFLVDYGNREIKMSALVKAVFLLFLKHPEGIRFKELSDYYGELLNIYQSLKPRGSLEKQQNSIREITNPFSNSINEKCARIREAFLGSFCEVLAQNYFVTGERGEAKRITLDRSLVLWEE